MLSIAFELTLKPQNRTALMFSLLLQFETRIAKIRCKIALTGPRRRRVRGHCSCLTPRVIEEESGWGLEGTSERGGGCCGRVI